MQAHHTALLRLLTIHSINLLDACATHPPSKLTQKQQEAVYMRMHGGVLGWVAAVYPFLFIPFFQ